MSGPVAIVLERLDRVRRAGRGFTARCPAHEDRTNSLSVVVGDDGRVLLNCFARCHPEVVVRSMGLEWRDLFADARRARARPSRWMSPLNEARRATLREARRQIHRLVEP